MWKCCSYAVLNNCVLKLSCVGEQGKGQVIASDSSNFHNYSNVSQEVAGDHFNVVNLHVTHCSWTGAFDYQRLPHVSLFTWREYLTSWAWSRAWRRSGTRNVRTIAQAMFSIMYFGSSLKLFFCLSHWEAFRLGKMYPFDCCMLHHGLLWNLRWWCLILFLCFTLTSRPNPCHNLF